MHRSHPWRLSQDNASGSEHKLTLLAPYMPPIQRLIRHMRVKWPHIDLHLRRHRHRFPEVIRTTIDKTHPPAAPAE